MKDFIPYAFGVFVGIWIAGNQIPNWLFWTTVVLWALGQATLKVRIKYK